MHSLISSSRPFVRRPLALAISLSLCSLVALNPIQSAQAASGTEQAVLREYHIAPGALAASLNQFSGQAGIYLVGHNDLTAGKTSKGLDGRYSIERALALLLDGTGLQAVPQASGGYVLQPDPNGTVLQMDSTSIIGSGTGAEQLDDNGYNAKVSSTAGKTSTSLAETPRSISVVTRQRMVDQQSQTLTDVLGYVPGIFAPP